MGISKGSAQWEGSFKEGHGTMKPAHGSETPYLVASRFEGAPAATPKS